MSVITKGKTFANGEQLTAGKLNQMLDAAVFSSAAVDNTKTTLSGGAITIAPSAITATEVAQSFLDTIYPVGSVYINATVATNPGTLLGFGTWTAFGAGRVPVGIDSSDTDFDSAEETGGAKTHTLSTSEMPSHTHDTGVVGQYDRNFVAAQRISVPQQNGFDDDGNLGTASSRTTSTGGGGAHNNLQPYIVVYMWKRTA
jgi:hypothetical protein